MAQFPNTTNADGIWTLKKVRRAILGDNWPEVAPPSDQFFADTVLLLQADGFADGSQNNTFLDSSTNTHTITRNGNVTQGSFSPFSQDEGKWGVSLESTTAYVQTPTTADFALSSNDFCYEGWIYATSLDERYPRCFGLGPYYNNINSFGVMLVDNYVESINLYFQDGNGLARKITSGVACPLNEWVHIAAVRSGNNVALFLNGTRIGTYTANGAIGSGNTYAFIGHTVAHPSTSPEGFTGYFSNVRLVNGSSIYDPTQTSITIPTTPFSDVTNTALLTGQSNRFVDNSSNNHTLTSDNQLSVGTSPKIAPFSPFAPSTAYDPATKGGSGYFDGAHPDELSTPNDASLNLSGIAWTAECWVYLEDDYADYGAIFAKRVSSGGTTSYEGFINRTSGALSYFDGSIYASTGVVPRFSWSHLAWSHNGTTLKMFLNGNEVFSQNISVTERDYPLFIGGLDGYTGENFGGYMSDFRIVKGTALYTSAFTPPTAPLTAITNTSLLCNFTNAGIYDGTGRNVLETVGNAQVDTAVKKYGTGSMQFDGTGDYITAASDVLFGYGTGDFTIEGWHYLTVDGTRYLFDQRVGASTAAVPTLLILSGQYTVYVNGAYQITGGTVVTNTWVHWALVRNSGVTTLYINGTSVGSFSDSTNYVTSQFRVGGAWTNDFNWAGYIDDLRITKGVARYTANFTPPAAVLPKQ